MTELEQLIQQTLSEHQAGNITLDERDYILLEIRDVRAAQECAHNEELFRHIVQCCNLALKLA